MSIITSHDITLYGSMGPHAITLCPLTDQHLPYLYRWNADPELLYWTEGGEDLPLAYTPEDVDGIYGSVSQNAFCFLICVDAAPVGDCWLQKMNLPQVQAMYAPALDVRRIDMAIGEKSWWGKGLGTAFIRMLTEFAFYGQGVDALHCFCEDYNVRSRRVWEKNGFSLILQEALPQPQKGRYQYHYRLTRAQFIQNRRFRPEEKDVFFLPLQQLQPSQLYISQGKLRLVRQWFDPADPGIFDPIPVKKWDGALLMTDGHTRAAAACLAGWVQVPVYWERDELDWDAYATDLAWCREAGVTSPYDLTRRMVSFRDYQELWIKKCMEMR